MTVLADFELRALGELFVSPFAEGTSGSGLVSWGLSSYGYDARLGDEVWLIHTSESILDEPEVIDPKAKTPLPHKKLRITETARGRWVLVPPHSFCLAHTVERFRIPSDCIAIAMGKSSYARCGLFAGMTPAEPGWEGQLTLELANVTPRPVKVYVGEGITQIVLFRGRPCERDYPARSNRYQGQVGVVQAKAGKE